MPALEPAAIIVIRGGSPPDAALAAVVRTGHCVIVAWPKHPKLVANVLAAVRSGAPVVTALLEGSPDAVSFRHVLHSAPAALREKDSKVAHVLFGRIALPLRAGGAHETVSLAALGGACRSAVLSSRTRSASTGRQPSNPGKHLPRRC